MTPEQLKLRADAIVAALEYGYTRQSDGSLKAPPGKFEGEPFYMLYFHNQAMEGCADEPLYRGDDVAADIVEVLEDERAAFELSADTAFVALWYSDNGFVTLRELTSDEYDELRAEHDSMEDEQS